MNAQTSRFRQLEVTSDLTNYCVLPGQQLGSAFPMPHYDRASRGASAKHTLEYVQFITMTAWSTVRAPVFGRHQFFGTLRALRKSPWKFIIWMNELKLGLHCMLLVSYIKQYFNTSITVLTNQVWKLLIGLFKVPNTGAFTVLAV